MFLSKEDSGSRRPPYCFLYFYGNTPLYGISGRDIPLGVGLPGLRVVPSNVFPLVLFFFCAEKSGLGFFSKTVHFHRIPDVSTDNTSSVSNRRPLFRIRIVLLIVEEEDDANVIGVRSQSSEALYKVTEGPKPFFFPAMYLQLGHCVVGATMTTESVFFSCQC